VKENTTTSIFSKIISAAVLLAIFATSSEVFASEPGESNTWNLKTLGGNGPGSLRSQEQVSETRNNGNLVTVWRSNDDSSLWVGNNSGPAFNFASAATNVAPNVVPYGPNGFAIFHTGTDNRVYWSRNVLGGNSDA
jgi:hypothetical protein